MRVAHAGTCVAHVCAGPCVCVRVAHVCVWPVCVCVHVAHVCVWPVCVCGPCRHVCAGPCMHYMWYFVCHVSSHMHMFVPNMPVLVHVNASLSNMCHS